MLTTAASTLAARRLTASPGISRGEGQRLARQELSRSIYQPSFWSRLWQHVAAWLASLHPAGGLGWPGWLGLALFAAAAAALAAAVLYHLGPVRREARSRLPLAAGAPVSAGAHRLAAEGFARAGNYRDAIIEQVRAIAAGLETRRQLPVRPGRTAAELGAEAGTVLPGEAAALAAAVRLFDAVRYGGRPGSRQAYQQIADLDQRISTTPAQPGPPARVAGGSRASGTASTEPGRPGQ